MTVYDIDASGGVVRFARIFIRRRLMGFTKDVRVCLQRLGWSITSDARKEPIRVLKLKRARMPVLPIPWKLKVDHVVEISIQTLADDAIASTTSYFRALKADPHLQDKFVGV
jgi:hypothetical protein